MCSLCEPEKWKETTRQENMIYRPLTPGGIDFCVTNQGKYFIRDEKGSTFTLHRCMVCGRKLF